jgi:hypothetical protein
VAGAWHDLGKRIAPIRNILRLFHAAVPLVLLAALLTLVAREQGEGGRFLGSPCRENTPPPTSTPLTVLAEGPPAPAVAATAPPLDPAAVPAERQLTAIDAPLAYQYEPILKVAKADRFWPVSVPTVLGLTMGDRKTKFISPTRTDDPAQLSDLRPGGVKSESLDYPAQADHVQDEFCTVGRALGIPATSLGQWRTYPDLLLPNASAEFYFLERGRPNGARDLQYWFFYPLNYLPILTDNVIIQRNPVGAVEANADFHEGDFEHVTVHLRRSPDGDFEPAGVTMGRHASNEDAHFEWSDSKRLQRLGDHAIVYASFGGHASYNRCGRQDRPVGPLIDWTFCGDEWTFSFGPETPLVNLRGVPWACWPGHFGEVPHPEIKNVFVAGPVAPNFQAENGGFECGHR